MLSAMNDENSCRKESIKRPRSVRTPAMLGARVTKKEEIWLMEWLLRKRKRPPVAVGQRVVGLGWIAR